MGHGEHELWGLSLRKPGQQLLGHGKCGVSCQGALVPCRTWALPPHHSPMNAAVLLVRVAELTVTDRCSCLWGHLAGTVTE